MILLKILLPFLVGLSLGLIGGGGTILAVPIFIYAFKVDPKSAIGMSLGVVSLVSLLGSYSHWKKGNIRLENAAFFTPFAMLGAFIGAKIANLPQVSGKLQITIFGIVVLISSTLMVFKKDTEAQKEDTKATKELEKAKFSEYLIVEWRVLFFMSLLGFLVGLLTGFVGVGGGFLIVPALVIVGKLSIHHAVGTSLIIIFFNSMSGFLGYIGKVKMDWSTMLFFLILSILGVFIGSQFTNKIEKSLLQKFFGVFLFLMGIYLIFDQIYISNNEP